MKYEKQLKAVASILAEAQAIAPQVTTVTRSGNTFEVTTSSALDGAQITALSALNLFTMGEI